MHNRNICRLEDVRKVMVLGWQSVVHIVVLFVIIQGVHVHGVILHVGHQVCRTYKVIRNGKVAHVDNTFQRFPLAGHEYSICLRMLPFSPQEFTRVVLVVGVCMD